MEDRVRGANVRRWRKAWRCARRTLWRRGILRYGVAAATEHEAVVVRLRPDVVVDVGANRGQFTLLVKGVVPTARVWAFEPGEDALSVLRRVARELDGVTVVPVACGAEPGSGTLHVTDDADNSSLLSPTEAQLRLHPRSAVVARNTTRIAPLDELVDRRQVRGTSLLKVDVQGMETQVLRGAEALLAELTYVYVELSFVERYAGGSTPAEIVGLLERHGFALVHLHNPIRGRGGLVQVDALFGRSSSHRWSPVLDPRR